MLSNGGVSDDVSLTAYITAAMLELDTSTSDPVVQRCLSCLKASVDSQLENLYTTALLSYTFTLAGDEEMRSILITYLNKKSNTQGGYRHWDRAGASGKGLDSLEVEMTSYVLLALLSGPALPDFGLDYSSSIVRWLVQQQNPYGGFSSTQDTVVALQALAKYGEATYSAEGSTAVTVTSLGGLNIEFRVDQSNRLLYQEQKLSEISMHNNIPPPLDFSAFNIITNTMTKCKISRPQLILFVHVRYQGRREETNMVIINIKLLSGYILDKSSLELLKSDRSVKRVDLDEGYINIYLDGLKKDETLIYSVTMEEDVPVRNLKPAVVKVYDYYQTSDEAVTEYCSPCAEKVESEIVPVTTPQHRVSSVCSSSLLTDIVGEGPLEAIEDESALLPGLQDLPPHLHQVALAHLLGEDEVVAGLHAVARRLHLGAQVELLLPDGQVAGHRTGLRGANTPQCSRLDPLSLTDLSEVLGPHLDLPLHQLLPVEGLVLQPLIRVLPPPPLLLQYLTASQALSLLQICDTL
ncbi:hypothetical protein F7725_023057 [Dissostichus mawsoni]|uniref:Alpha-macroglobulin receptor-binding domain-containing protein n=1 Tax=Dissostichus mawsoni TaxID=36200 RepID=A0A7J5YZJ8_DISMA|nr:hypothetical protein F7725_023057 [Dissostichus mawsoni]